VLAKYLVDEFEDSGGRPYLMRVNKDLTHPCRLKLEPKKDQLMLIRVSPYTGLEEAFEVEMDWLCLTKQATRFQKSIGRAHGRAHLFIHVPKFRIVPAAIARPVGGGKVVRVWKVIKVEEEEDEHMDDQNFLPSTLLRWRWRLPPDA
jgi:hypothetical protein